MRARIVAALIALADVYERMKQGEAAIDLYDSVPKDSPLRVNADIQAALLLETLGKSKEAGEHLSAEESDCRVAHKRAALNTKRAAQTADRPNSALSLSMTLSGSSASPATA